MAAEKWNRHLAGCVRFPFASYNRSEQSFLKYAVELLL